MFRFLGRMTARQVPTDEDSAEPRFTRFQSAEESDALRVKYSRRQSAPTKPPTAEIVLLPVTERPAEPAPQPQLDENAHLYSSSEVPVNVLKKALPNRFS